jgi:DNA-binding CsgD family transcriptional regulator
MSLLHLAQGNREAAASAIGSMVETAGSSRGSGAGLSRARLLAASAHILVACGKGDAARAVAAELAEIATNVGAPVLLALSAQAAGAVLLVDGETRAALARLSESLRAWQELGMPYEAARVRVLMAKACRALGDEETADMHSEGARAVFRQLGATPDLANRERSGPAGSSGPVGGLTGREREVLALVASGMTNRRIAETLRISEHTVARHLSNIFDKLDVTSRTAASAVAREHKFV